MCTHRWWLGVGGGLKSQGTGAARRHKPRAPKTVPGEHGLDTADCAGAGDAGREVCRAKEQGCPEAKKKKKKIPLIDVWQQVTPPQSIPPPPPAAAVPSTKCGNPPTPPPCANRLWRAVMRTEWLRINRREDFVGRGFVLC